MGHENRENLDLAKISRYTVHACTRIQYYNTVQWVIPFTSDFRWSGELLDVLFCMQEAQRRAKAERAGKAAHKSGGEPAHGSKEQKQPASKAQGSKPGVQVMVGSEEPQQQKTQAKVTKSRSLV